MSNVVLAFAVISLTYAYLSVNTPDRHGALQTLHYIMTHIAIFFTGYLGYAYAASGEEPSKLLITWNNGYYAILTVIVAYFLIHILNKVLEETGARAV